jgi:hypothetical protein
MTARPTPCSSTASTTSVSRAGAAAAPRAAGAAPPPARAPPPADVCVSRYSTTRVAAMPASSGSSSLVSEWGAQ